MEMVTTSSEKAPGAAGTRISNQTSGRGLVECVKYIIAKEKVLKWLDLHLVQKPIRVERSAKG